MESSAPLTGAADRSETTAQAGGLATSTRKVFGRVTAVAARLFDAPFALLELAGAHFSYGDPAVAPILYRARREFWMDGPAVPGDRPWLVEDAYTESLGGNHPLASGAYGLRFYIEVPVQSDAGVSLGSLCVADREPHNTTADQVAGLADLAEILAEEFGLHMQAGQALIRERTGRTRAEGVTRTLEQSLRPSAVPVLPGLELAVSYHPTDGEVVGGDFYDAFATPSGYGLVIGDVRGHGPVAAAVTATARHGVAALAQQPWSPAWALTSLNALMLQQGEWDPELFCTVALLQLRSAADGGMDATVGLAGHPTPLVVRGDGTVEAVGTPGTALGLTADPSFPEVNVHLEAGDALVMYTDGVTEVRAGDTPFDVTTLHALLERMPGRPADEVAAEVERAVSAAAGGFGDDTAVLVARPVRTDRPSRVVHTTG